MLVVFIAVRERSRYVRERSRTFARDCSQNELDLELRSEIREE